MINTFPVLLKGSIVTLQLTFMTILLGSILGIILALLKISNNKFANSISSFYIWIFRGTPLLLQIFFFYYGMPMFGIEMNPFESAVLGLSLNCGAYMAEIIRGGILSIDKGQFEAAKALGLNYYQTMKGIILPQTFRTIIPPIGNEFITIIKETSIVSSITMVELMRCAQQMYSTTFKPVEIFLSAGLIYLALTTVFSSIFALLENKVAKYE